MVLCLVVATNFFIAKEKEKVKRIKVENRLAEELKEKDILQEELIAEKNWSDSLEGQLRQREREINFALERLEQKEKEVSSLVSGLEEERNERVRLERDLYKLETKLTILSKKDRRFRRKLEGLEVELGKIVVKSEKLPIGELEIPK